MAATLSNTGTGMLNNIVPSITGANPGDFCAFRLALTPCGATLAASRIELLDLCDVYTGIGNELLGDAIGSRQRDGLAADRIPDGNRDSAGGFAEFPGELPEYS